MTGGLLEIGEALLATSERRLEIVSRNVANASTAGFKKQETFAAALVGAARSGEVTTPAPTFTNFSQGAMRMTGRSFDIAIDGPGFFQLRSGDTIYYSRNGEFDLNADGMLVNAHGMILQTAGGEDLLISDPAAEVLADGLVLEGGLPVARIGVFRAADEAKLQHVGGAMFFAGDADVSEHGAPSLRQGMVEAANVEMSGEMVGMMEALRSAEIGSRIVQTYDTLIDQSITTFGKGV